MSIINIFPTVKLNSPLEFFMSAKTYAVFASKCPKNPQDALKEFSKCKNLLIYRNDNDVNKLNDSYEDTFIIITEFGSFLCRRNTEFDNLHIVTFWEDDFRNRQNALKHGLCFNISRYIHIKFQKSSSEFIGYKYGRDSRDRSLDCLSAINEINKAFDIYAIEKERFKLENEKISQEESEEIVEIPLSQLSEELEAGLNLVEKYSEVDFSVEQTKALEAESLHYYAVGPSIRKSDKFSYKFYFRNFEKISDIKSRTTLTLEDIKGKNINGTVIAVGSEEFENGEIEKYFIEIEFNNQIPISQIQSTGLMKINANPITREVQLKTITALREDTAKAKYFENIFGNSVPQGFDEINLEDLKADFKNREYPLTDSQVEAVTKGIKSKDIYLVMGPPGTGKTTVILEWVKYFALQKNMRVLISSQNNSAVDNVLTRFLDTKGIDILRTGNGDNSSPEVSHLLYEQKLYNTRAEISKKIHNKKIQYKNLIGILAKAEKFIEYKNYIGNAYSTLERHSLTLYDDYKSIKVYYEEFKCYQNILRKFKAQLENHIFRTETNGFKRILYQITTIFGERRLEALKRDEAKFLKNLNIKISRYNLKRETIFTECFKPYMEQLAEFKSLKNEIETIFNELDIKIFNVLNLNIDKENTSIVEFCETILKNSEKIYLALTLMNEWQETVNTTQMYALEEVMLNNVNVVGGTCIGIATNSKYSDIDYDVTIMDEAGQIQMHNGIVPMSASNKLIMLGDHKQLPPFVDDEKRDVIKSLGTNTERYTQSVFDYLYNKLPDSNKTMLDTQFRIPAKIADILSEAFYNNQYKTLPKKREEGFYIDFISKQPLVFVSTQDSNERFEDKIEIGKNSFIYKNKYEAEIAAKIYKKLVTGKYKNLSVKIIAGLNAQLGEIKSQLSNYFTKDIVKSAVSTVDSFQGQECDVVIYSFTRSDENSKSIDVGFLKDLRRLNVAMSRAKKVLIIIGDISYLNDLGDRFKNSTKRAKLFAKFINSIITAIEDKGSGEIVMSKELLERLGKVIMVDFLPERVYMDHILKEISLTYPNIDLNFLTFFGKVYYPIATVSAEIKEESFEEFTIVEHAVLKFLNAGFTSAEEISDMMGLTKQYIAKIITVLISCSLVEESSLKLTALGTRSLKEGKKINIIDTVQNFEIDAANGYPIMLNKSVYKNGRFNKGVLPTNDKILFCKYEVDTNKLIELFNTKSQEEIENRFRSTINVNVRKIENPQFIKLQYVTSYILVLEGYEPIVFCKMDVTLPGKPTKSSWQPFAVSSIKEAELLEWENPIFNSLDTINNIKLTYNEIVEYGNSEQNTLNFTEYVNAYIDTFLKLNRKYCIGVENNYYIVSSKAFKTYNDACLTLLVGLGSVNNIYVFAYPDLQGRIAKFSRDTRDKRLAYICQYLKKVCEKIGFNNLKELLFEYFNEHENENIIDGIVKALGIKFQL